MFSEITDQTLNCYSNDSKIKIHTHLLGWLNKIPNIDVHHIRASIPKDNTFLAYLVSLLYTFCQCYINAMFKQVLLFNIGKGKLFYFTIQYMKIFNQLLLK